MTYLVVEPFPCVKLRILESLPDERLRWRDHDYTQVHVPEDFLSFYDWVRNGEGCIVGLELYIWDEHAILLGDLCSVITGHSSGAARITFLPDATGISDGTQGFGNIFFYRCLAIGWLVAVEIDLWSRAGDKRWLEHIAGSELRDRPPV